MTTPERDNADVPKQIRSKEDIWHAFINLGEDENYLEWKGDNFKYGFLMGKFAALGWVLGDPIADLKNHYDFEDFELEQKASRDARHPRD